MEKLYSNGKQDGFLQLIRSSEQEKFKAIGLLEGIGEPTVIRVAVYLRVSTLKQAGKDKASLKEQELQTKEIIDRNGWIFTNIYKDAGKSGTKIIGRDAYIKMMDDAKRDIFDVIIFWDFDRFGRGGVGGVLSARDELRKHGVQITSVTCPIEIDDPRYLSPETTFDKDVLVAIQAIVAKEENKKRALRMGLAKIDKAKKGLIPGKIPYGYRKIVKHEGDKKTEKIVVNKKESLVVQEIFNLCDKQGYGMRKIAETINLKGMLTTRGGKWECASVQYLLNNWTYTGLVRWGWYLSRTKKERLRLTNGDRGIVEEGRHPAIISKKQFTRVKKKLEMRKRIGGRAVSSTGLLVGIAKCGRCGGGTYVSRWLHCRRYRKKTNKKEPLYFQAYLCANYARMGRSGCSSKYVMAQKRLEEKVIKEIKKLSKSEESKKAFVAELKKGDKERIEKEILFTRESLHEFGKKLERQKRAYEAGIKPLGEYLKDVERHDLDKLEAKKVLSFKEKELSQEMEFKSRKIKSLLALFNFNKLWDKSSFRQKKELIQSIIKKVEIKKGSIKIEYKTERSS